jgi:8-amino-7-oxononanoate synthase
VNGFTPVHQQLVEELAHLEQTESAVLFPTGYAANVGLMSTLPEAGDLVLSDAFNHASIIDGCRLSRAERFIYPHGDVGAVASLLKLHRRRFTRAFLVTESIFSMDGDRAPLEDLVEIAAEHSAILIVDEAHATGVVGRDGGGLCADLALESQVPIRVGTLSKSIGALGGFVAGPQVVIDYLINRARPLIFSTSFPEGIALRALQGLRIMREQPERRERLHRLSKLVCESIRPRIRSQDTSPLGSTSGSSSFPVSPIYPVVVGGNDVALRVSETLHRAGFLVPAIRPPTVPAGTARLRISLSAGHAQEDVQQMLVELQAAIDELVPCHR